MPIDPALAPRDDEKEDDLVHAWIERQNAWEREKTTSDTSEWEGLVWTWERLRYLTEYLPDKAWTVIKRIVSMNSSPEIINNLIDESVDDLIRNFGPGMIDVLEADTSRLPELQPLRAYAQELNALRVTWVRSEFHGRARDGSIGQELAPRDDENDEDLARAWVAHHLVEYNSDRSNALLWSSDRVHYLVDYLPQKAWRVVLLIWSLNQSLKIMQILSAGSIEDLLAKHGDEMIALVEAEAKRDPSFAKLLGGVWKSSMTDEVWARLQSVWDTRGWDGIPEDSPSPVT
jgi:hypothetical protein